jgi:hypothetical protein
MSTCHIRQPDDDESWLLRITDALDAVRALLLKVSREDGDTSFLTRQLRYLRRSLAAWLADDRTRARGLLAAALNLDDGPPPAVGPASAPESMNGQAGEHTALRTKPASQSAP